MRKIILAALSAGYLAVGTAPAQAITINGTFRGDVSNHGSDSLNLFGAGTVSDFYSQSISGSFFYDTAALGAVSVTPNAGGTAGQTDYSWTNNTGAISLSVTTAYTTTTVASSVSGGVFRADRQIAGSYQLLEVYANDGVNHIEQYFVSHVDFLGTGGLTIPDYVFSLPNGDAFQYGESYLTVGSEVIRSIDSLVSTSVSSSATAAPEPGTLSLVGAGLFAIGFARSRRRLRAVSGFSRRG